MVLSSSDSSDDDDIYTQSKGEVFLVSYIIVIKEIFQGVYFNSVFINAMFFVFLFSKALFIWFLSMKSVNFPKIHFLL